MADTARDLDGLRAQLARASPRIAHGTIRLGEAIDAALPGSGLARGTLHEAAGAGPEIEHASAATLFVAAALARSGGGPDGGPALWVSAHGDLHAPALAGVGLHPDRVIHVEAKRPAAVLLAMEDALRHAGLAGVAGEFSGRLSLTASRRLLLAAEASGTICFLLRRSRRFDDPALREPCAAVTRWRIGSLPSDPPLANRTIPGLGRARWRVELIRCRDGVPATWIMEGADAQGRLGIPADLADRPAAPQRAGRAA